MRRLALGGAAGSGRLRCWATRAWQRDLQGEAPAEIWELFACREGVALYRPPPEGESSAACGCWRPEDYEMRWVARGTAWEEGTDRHSRTGDGSCRHWGAVQSAWLHSPDARRAPALHRPLLVPSPPLRSRDEQPLGADQCGAASVLAQSARAHGGALACGRRPPELAVLSSGNWMGAGAGLEPYQASAQGLYVLPVQVGWRVGAPALLHPLWSGTHMPCHCTCTARAAPPSAASSP